MRSKVRAAIVAALSVCALSAWGSVSGVRAEGLDPTRPHTIVVGPPRGPAPSERVDGRRTGQSKTRLPLSPVEAWRRHLGGNVEAAPLVDEAGRIYVALSVPEVVALGTDGKEIFRTRLGSAPAVTAPVLTSDGTLVVVTGAGVAIGIGPDGRARYATPLGQRGRDLTVAPLARSDGSVVIGGRVLIELGPSGEVRSRVSLPERAVGALLEGPEGILATADSGSVYAYRPPGAPRKVGSFGGPVKQGAVVAGRRTLLAVVGGKSLVELDLRSGLSHVRVGDLGLGAYDEPVTVHPRGFALLTTMSGLLFGVDAAGNERLRAALDKSTSPGTGDPRAAGVAAGTGFFNPSSDGRPSPALVVDGSGRIAFARSGGRVGVMAPDGNIAIASERLCPAPIALQPAGEDKLLVACRDGTVWMLKG